MLEEDVVILVLATLEPYQDEISDLFPTLDPLILVIIKD